MEPEQQVAMANEGTGEDQALLQRPNNDMENGQPEEAPKEPEIVPIDYKFMDGLRGLGAFAVYVNHFMLLFYPWYTDKEMSNGKEKYYPPDWMRDTPARVFYAGQLWVSIFFILSGFVLPMNFFKTGRQSAIIGGTFRRYLRLMIPVLVVITLVYFFQRMDAYGDHAMTMTIRKNWTDAFLDGLFGTWFANDGKNDTWLTPTWTLGIELWATFFVYLLAQTVRFYDGRRYIYGIVIFVLIIVHLFEHTRITKWALNKFWNQLPLFFMGTAFADIEFMKDWRPIDKFRDLPTWLCWVRNIVLLTIFFTYGSLNRYGCYKAEDEQCPFFNAITLNFYMPYWIAIYIGALAIFFLALVSPAFQWILASPPLQFLGKISYTLYLSHEWIIEWCMQDFYHHFREMDKQAPDTREFDNFNDEVEDDAPTHAQLVLWNFLIFTPILILLSWILAICVDIPAKDFAYELDIQCRIEPPKPKKGEEPVERPPFWKFLVTSWKFWALIGYLVFVVAFAEIFVAFHGENPRYTRYKQEHVLALG